jgi:copper chaperone
METVTLKVNGMTCQGCVRSVKRVLERVPGVIGAEVDLERGQARVQIDQAKVAPGALKAAIEQAGYEAA